MTFTACLKRLFGILVFCVMGIATMTEAQAATTDLTNTRWRILSGLPEPDLLFLEGKAGKPVKVAQALGTDARRLKYEGRFDGRSLVLEAIDVNRLAGERETLTLTLSTEGQKLEGTVRLLKPGQFDDTEPVAFERVGGPPPRGDDVAPPGEGVAPVPDLPGVRSQLPTSGHGEGPVPLGLAIGGGLLGLLIGAAVAARANRVQGAAMSSGPEIDTGALGHPMPDEEPEAEGAAPEENQEAPFRPPTHVGGDLEEEDGQDHPPRAEDEEEGSPPPPRPVRKPPSKNRRTRPKNRIVTVSLQASHVPETADQYELVATVVAEVGTAHAGSVSCSWPDGASVQRLICHPPGGPVEFRRVWTGHGGDRVTACCQIDLEAQPHEASCILPPAVQTPVAVKVTVTKSGFASGRLMLEALTGHDRVHGFVRAAHGSSQARVELAVRDAKWEAAGQREGAKDWTWLGEGRTGLHGEFAFSLDPILLRPVPGGNMARPAPLMLELDEGSQQDMTRVDEQAARLDRPELKAYKSAVQDCRAYPAAYFSQRCALPESDQAAVSSAANLLRHAIAYTVMHRNHFAAYRVRAVSVTSELVSSVIDALLEWSGLAEKMWKWLKQPKPWLEAASATLGRAAEHSAVLWFSLRALRMAIRGWEAACLLLEKGVRQVAKFILKKTRETRQLPRLIEQLTAQRSAAFSQSAEAAAATQAEAREIVQIVYHTVACAVVTLVLFMGMAALLGIGCCLLTWAGLTAALETVMRTVVVGAAVRMTPKTRSSVATMTDLMEGILGSACQALLEGTGTLMGHLLNVLDPSKPSTGLDRLVDDCFTTFEQFDSKRSLVLQDACRRSVSREVPVPWQDAAARVRSEELQDAARFQEHAGEADYQEWVSAHMKAWVKILQGLLWGMATARSAAGVCLKAIGKAAEGVLEEKLAARVKTLIESADRLMKFADNIEKLTSLVDLVIWARMLYRELWWLSYAEAAAQVRIEQLYDRSSVGGEP